MSKRHKAGMPPLAEGEKTHRITANLPESTYERAKRKRGKKAWSAYLRDLVERDLSKAG